MINYKIKFSKSMVKQLGRPPKTSFLSRTAAETFGLGKYGSGSYLLNPLSSKVGWYVEEVKGKGWQEAPDASGKAPRHREVALRGEAKGAQNNPMKKSPIHTQQYTVNGMTFTLLGVEYTEAKADKKAIQYSKDNRVAEVKKVGDEYLIYVSEQYASTKEQTILDKWNKHLDSLDRFHKGFEVFDSNSGESSIKELSKIIEGGQETLYEKVDELRDDNSEIEYEMFKSTFKEFLKDEGIEEDSIESEEDFRMDFEGHINWNIEKLFDFDVLLKDGNNRFGIESEDEDDPERKAFKKEALKYISEKQFEEIMNNSSGGTGFFGILINAQDIIKAIRDNEKTVNDNQLIIGVHDMMSGSGYFKEARAEYKMNLDKAELDEGSYSLGDIFGHVDWKWR